MRLLNGRSQGLLSTRAATVSEQASDLVTRSRSPSIVFRERVRHPSTLKHAHLAAAGHKDISLGAEGGKLPDEQGVMGKVKS